MMIVPPELLLYIATSSEEKHVYNIAGPSGPEKFEGGVAGYEARAFRGCGVFTSVPFEISEEADSLQMLQRNTQVGEFYRMRAPSIDWPNNATENAKHKNYMVRRRPLTRACAQPHSTRATMMADEEKKERARIRARTWYAENKKRARANQANRLLEKRDSDNLRKREYYHDNKARIKQKQKEYASANRVKITAQKKTRRTTDPSYKLECLTRSRLCKYTKSKGTYKGAKTFELVGCDAESLRCYLDSQWTSSAPYDVDHIFPFAAYAEDELHKVCHWSNQQPLAATENLAKRASLPPIWMARKVQKWAWPQGITESDLPDDIAGVARVDLTHPLAFPSPAPPTTN